MALSSTTRRIILLALAISASAPLLAAAPAYARINTTVNADGDSCDIDRGGLKTPGTKKGTKCCSVFDSNDCVELPKSTTTNMTQVRSVSRKP